MKKVLTVSRDILGKLFKRPPPGLTPPKLIVNSHGAVAIDPKTFLDSGIVQSQIAAARDLAEMETKKLSKPVEMQRSQQQREGSQKPSAKQDSLKAIAGLPDGADMEDIMYRLYVLTKIRKGQEDVEQGRTLTSEGLEREIEKW